MLVCNRCKLSLPDDAEVCTRCGGTMLTKKTPRPVQNGQRPAGNNGQRPVQGGQRPTQNSHRPAGNSQRPAQGGQRPTQNSQRPTGNSGQSPNGQKQTRNSGQRPPLNNVNEIVTDDLVLNDDLTNTEQTENKGKKKKERKKNGSKQSNIGNGTIKEWLLTLLQMIVPIWNIVFIIRTLINKDVPDFKKNYIKAFLIYFVAMTVISIVVTMLVGEEIAYILINSTTNPK